MKARAPKLTGKAEEALSWKELEPLAVFVRPASAGGRRDNVAALVEFVSRRAGRPINKTNVKAWLNVNPALRAIPNFAFGLVLMEARKIFCGK